MSVGLYLGELIIGGIFASEIWVGGGGALILGRAFFQGGYYRNFTVSICIGICNLWY